jgi:hypothetical protein
MEKQLVTEPQLGRIPGPRLFWLGIGIGLLGLFLYGLQFILHQLVVPWYAPIMATVGVICLAVAVWQRPRPVRIAALAFLLLLAGIEWAFLLSLSRVPPYEGRAHPGEAFPTFRTTLADGRPFSDQDLKQGQRSVMVFFRGRW